MDISDFAESFYEEAEELLDDMEQQLLDLDPDAPDIEQLNAIFRAAHSIKGGAGAFGFSVLQETTHVLENLLDDARRDRLALTTDIIDTFLQAKDVLADQLAAYRQSEEPDQQAFDDICRTLRALEPGAQAAAPVSAPPASAAPAPAAVDHHADPLGSIALTLQQIAREAQGPATTVAEAPKPAAPAETAEDEAPAVPLLVRLIKVKESDRNLLLEELNHFGQVAESSGDEAEYRIVLHSNTSPDDIEAVLCFIIDADQVAIEAMAPAPAAAPAPAPVVENKPAPEPAKRKPAAPKKDAAASESTSIRVTVDKVDAIINLVGELVITQSMLEQTVESLGGNMGALISDLTQLKRNARDLQEAVMSIRMLPMDYVFSRYPRQVRDLSAKLNKEVELVTEGKSTELDKGLIERIIDPMTHLIRNSLDHGIEPPDVREAAGKPRTGQLRLSARQQGGNIIIEVADDGAGLNREKLLAKARSNGLDVSDDMPDEEVWMLIFAPGFSTAESVSDVSGRGVGMDVVRRNIQSMGGHVEIESAAGKGTTTRVVLPLTLAILDGMSVRVGDEMFVLPLGVVSELVQPAEEDLFTMARDDVLLKVRDDYLPVVSLHEVMGVGGPVKAATDSIAIIVQGEDTRYALLVDEPVGQQQIVVKNLEKNYRRIPGVSAATILGDGRVALIIDVVSLYRRNQALKKSKAKTKKANTVTEY